MTTESTATTTTTTDDIQEHWRAAPNYPGYEVSDLGKVRRSAFFDSYGRLAFDARPIAQSLSGAPRRPSNGEYYTQYMEVSLRVGEKQRKHVKVHHLVCEAFHGPRPVGMVVCHGEGKELDNRAVNLRWDTQANNIIDMHTARGGHHNALKTECKHGHDLTDPENLYKNGTGRKCRTCAILRSKEQYAARKAQAT